MKRHRCLTQVDTELAKHNTCLEQNLFNQNHVLLATHVLEKKRGARAKIMLASYCPFCGKKLPGM